MEHSWNEITVEKMLLTQAAKRYQPINGSLELLPLCNMNCDMCYVRLSREEMEEKGRLRTADEWIQLAEQMEQAGVLFILLTGGEPLLFPDFRKVYLELRKRGMILTINTNGTLIDEERAEFFGKYKPRRINITLYGASEEAYEELCHYPGGYAKTVRGIKLLKQQGVDVKINGSVTKGNWQDTEAIYKIGKELDVPVHMDTYMVPGVRERNKAFNQQSRLTPVKAAAADIQTLREELSPDEFNQYVRKAILIVEKGTFSSSRHISCLAASGSFTINWQGEMRPCVTLSEPSVPVFEKGFEGAWKEIIERANRLLINEKCTRCSLRPICKTCVASAFWETGKYDGLPEYNCQCAEEFLRLLYKEQEELGL